jgi:hypothetical protein
MNIHVKIPSKIIANQIQQHIKKYQNTMIKLVSLQEWKDGSTYVNHKCDIEQSRIKDKKHMIISKDEEAFGKIQHPFIIKGLKKLGIQGIYLNIIKAIYDKPTANIILNEGN